MLREYSLFYFHIILKCIWDQIPLVTIILGSFSHKQFFFFSLLCDLLVWGKIRALLKWYEEKNWWRESCEKVTRKNNKKYIRKHFSLYMMDAFKLQYRVSDKVLNSAILQFRHLDSTILDISIRLLFSWKDYWVQLAIISANIHWYWSPCS